MSRESRRKGRNMYAERVCALLAAKAPASGDALVYEREVFSAMGACARCKRRCTGGVRLATAAKSVRLCSVCWNAAGGLPVLFAVQHARAAEQPTGKPALRLTAYRRQVLAEAAEDGGSLVPSGYSSAGRDAARWWGAVQWLHNAGLVDQPTGTQVAYATEAGRVYLARCLSLPQLQPVPEHA